MNKMNLTAEHHSSYEVNIGIEVHVQLTTASKIFCTCANTISHHPNSNICHICTGQPGTLPVLNKEVVYNALKAGVATRCSIALTSTFARKHYFYPDLPKNYQITQSDQPICSEGHVSIRLEDGTEKAIRLIRIHMEEDAGKNTHLSDTNESFVDLNRAGTPLLEIVSYPDISSSYEARKYLEELRLIVVYLGICSGNMEEGAFRADTNISVRKKGQKELGTKCELKNINSFKFISDAIEYETERQIALLEAGEAVRQETRLWNSKKGETETMRIKEEAADYRYFDDPDLPTITIADGEIALVKESMPELPSEKYYRFLREGLSPYEAEILIQDLELALFYEKAHALNPSRQLINWVLRDFMGSLKTTKTAVDESLIKPSHIAQLIELIEQGAINNRAGQEIFAEMAVSGKEPRTIMLEKGLEQIDNSAELEQIIAQILAENAESVALYKAGKDKLWGFFVGQAMQKTKGKGNPQTINTLLKKLLQ